jgi:hypothetical protein
MSLRASVLELTHGPHFDTFHCPGELVQHRQVDRPPSTSPAHEYRWEEAISHPAQIADPYQTRRIAHRLRAFCTLETRTMFGRQAEISKI